jgi:hypothetical protein
VECTVQPNIVGFWFTQLQTSYSTSQISGHLEEHHSDN